jgi:hypothetical protein
MHAYVHNGNHNITNATDATDIANNPNNMTNNLTNNLTNNPRCGISCRRVSCLMR